MDATIPAPPALPVRPRRRFRLALSLRAMMLLIVVVAAPTAWYVRQVHNQRRAVQALDRLKGYVDYEYEFADGQEIPNGRPWEPRWLLQLAGRDAFHRVTRVKIYEGDGSKLIPIVESFPHLEAIRMHKVQMDEDALARLARQTSLRELDMAFCPLEDAAIGRLATLPRLRKLDISYVKITDDALASLARCQTLEELDLQGDNVNRKGLKHLAQLPRLRRLNVATIETREILAVLGDLKQIESLEMFYAPKIDFFLSTRRDAAALDRGLRALPKLRSLSITGLISDEYLDLLTQLPNLEELNIEISSISDKGLTRLKNCPRLKKLTPPLHAKASTIAALQAAKPGLTIAR